jgi:amino-acid N-acetyltransferase
MNYEDFVAYFRTAAPYIHLHHGRIFVISFDGHELQHPDFKQFIQDIALLHVLGIKIVLVYGIRYQVNNLLPQAASIPLVHGRRVTDSHSLQYVLAACGQVGLNIQTYLAMGLNPVPKSKIQVLSGNFVLAKPLGIRDGVDFHYSGEVRKIDATGIMQQLNKSAIVLIPPIGYSPSGELFNLLAEEVATQVAIALRAAKWICINEHDFGNKQREFNLSQARNWLQNNALAEVKHLMNNAIQACQHGVERVHFISHKINGSLLIELFSREGIGTLVSYDSFDHIRQANIQDIGGLLDLIQPLEQIGVLVRRSREKLEIEIEHFTLQERDGMIIACAALYPFAAEKMAELACLVVHEQYRNMGRADNLLQYLINNAKKQGLEQIFVLTTHTAHWFIERGFMPAELDVLPTARAALYNLQRNSKVFIKQLG